MPKLRICKPLLSLLLDPATNLSITSATKPEAKAKVKHVCVSFSMKIQTEIILARLVAFVAFGFGHAYASNEAEA